MDLKRDEFVIEYDAQRLSVADLTGASDKAGFPARPVSETHEDNLPTFYQEAVAEARRTQKPLVIDFTAAWCEPCQRMLRTTFPDPKVAPLLEKCVLVTVDTDKHPGLSRRYGVVGLPDIRLLSPEGKEVRRLRGFYDPDAFAVVLDDLLASLSPAAERLITVTDAGANVRAMFNRDRGYVRLLLVLSPT